jgi:hypothetical protein
MQRHAKATSLGGAVTALPARAMIGACRRGRQLRRGHRCGRAGRVDDHALGGQG